MALHYEEHAPPTAVRDAVACLWTLHGTAPRSADFELILPDGRPELVVHLADVFRQRLSTGATRLQPRRMVVGQMTAGVAVAPGRRVATVGVRFTPAGLSPLCPWPQSTLVDAIVDVATLDAPRVQAMAHAAGAASTLGAAMAVLHDALVRAFASAPPVDRRLAHAIDGITGSGGMATMSAIARAAGATTRWLERRFLRDVGVSPKRFSRLVRFRHVLAALDGGRTRSDVAVALEHGFYDQAHFIAEFRDFAGTAPRRFVEQRLTALTRHFVDRAAVVNLQDGRRGSRRHCDPEAS